MEVTVTTMLMILGTMFAAMLSAIIVSIRMQHNDNRDTRQLIADTNLETRQVIADTNLETRQLIADTNLETRQVIADTNLETRQEATRQIERLGDKLSGELAEHKRIVEKNHDELRAEFAEHKRITESNHGKVVESLGDARERLARIEGHLRIPPPPPQTADTADQADRDGDARAA